MASRSFEFTEMGWAARRLRGCPHLTWFDESKAFLADFRHRALRHHAEGIFLCERIFGHTITNSLGSQIPVRWIGEQHVQEDLGFIPTASQWLECIQAEPWMNRSRRLSLELAQPKGDAA